MRRQGEAGRVPTGGREGRACPVIVRIHDLINGYRRSSTGLSLLGLVITVCSGFATGAERRADGWNCRWQAVAEREAVSVDALAAYPAADVARRFPGGRGLARRRRRVARFRVGRSRAPGCRNWPSNCCVGGGCRRTSAAPGDRLDVADGGRARRSPRWSAEPLPAASREAWLTMAQRLVAAQLARIAGAGSRRNRWRNPSACSRRCTRSPTWPAPTWRWPTCSRRIHARGRPG